MPLRAQYWSGTTLEQSGALLALHGCRCTCSGVCEVVPEWAEFFVEPRPARATQVGGFYGDGAPLRSFQ